MIGAGSLWGYPGKPLDLAIVLYVECTKVAHGPCSGRLGHPIRLREEE